MAGRVPHEESGSRSAQSHGPDQQSADQVLAGLAEVEFEAVLDTGRARGTLTEADLVEAIHDVELTPEVIEALVQRVRDEGIVFQADDLSEGDVGLTTLVASKPVAGDDLTELDFSEERHPANNGHVGAARSGPKGDGPAPRPTRRASSPKARPSGADYASGSAAEDPVHTYLKEIGKVALLSAELEVEMARRVEEGIFAAERIAAHETSI